MSATVANPRLVLASKNQGKLTELRALLRGKIPGFDVDVHLIDAAAAGAGDVAETGINFEDNALLKAHAIAQETGRPALADDSGLAVDVLGGAPGIFSARWSGRHGDDAANLRLLLAQLADIGPKHRGAEFVCAAAVAFPDGREFVQRGTLRGYLRTDPSGSNGFGYDPILVPEGMNRSCAELSAAEKNAISHRAQALSRLLPLLISELS